MGQREPAGQGIGAEEASGQKLPAGQRVELVGTGQYRPAEQLLQKTLPWHDTKEPGGHGLGTHMALSGQLKPAGQIVCLEEPALGQ